MIKTVVVYALSLIILPILGGAISTPVSALLCRIILFIERKIINKDIVHNEKINIFLTHLISIFIALYVCKYVFTKIGVDFNILHLLIYPIIQSRFLYKFYKRDPIKSEYILAMFSGIFSGTLISYIMLI